MPAPSPRSVNSSSSVCNRRVLLPPSSMSSRMIDRSTPPLLDAFDDFFLVNYFLSTEPMSDFIFFSSLSCAFLAKNIFMLLSLDARDWAALSSSSSTPPSSIWNAVRKMSLLRAARAISSSALFYRSITSCLRFSSMRMSHAA